MKNKDRFNIKLNVKNMPIGTYFENDEYINIVINHDGGSTFGECLNYPSNPFFSSGGDSERNMYKVISPEEANIKVLMSRE